MKYQNVIQGRFLSRPNRFLAKVEVEGREETVHVKNTGRCRELLLPGVAIWLEKSTNPSRKTAYDLFGVYKEGLGLVNMDSQAPNKVVGEWLRTEAAVRLLAAGGQNAGEVAGLLEEKVAGNRDTIGKRKANKPLPEISAIKPEYTYGSSRIDFYFERGEKKCLMEVKGVTLEREGIAYFPDAPTQRGIKHIQELERAAQEDYESYLAFVIQMPDILEVRPNDETHPEFGEALRKAQKAGVKVLALGCHMEEDEIYVCREKMADIR